MLCYNCMRDKGDRDVCPFCNTGALKDPELHQLSPGTVIGGRYTVGRVLGEGGFGITYIGLDNTLDIVVAVKEYFPYGCSHRSSNITAEVSVSGGSGEVYRKGKDRFLKEAKTVAKFLKDPGIVDIRDFFEENNTAYIVMEYLEGVDLRKYLKAHGRMEPEEAFRLLIPVMRSLEKMHRVGIIHRDISPDNIMYQPDGTLKLMDFGAARDYDDSRSMSVMLKHGYAPEEQYRRGGEQGPWTDVYGLCATIYRCITGKAPDEAIDRLAEDHLKKPSELGVTISPELEKALMYGLAVRKKDRCPDMTELLRLIDEAFNAEKTAPAVEIKPAEKGSVEEAKTTLADHPEVADEKTSLASDLPAEEEVKTTLATHMPAGEEVKTTLATHMPAEEEVKTTLATNMPAGEEVKTTLATNVPAGEEVKTTLAADMTIAGDPEPLIPKKPPVIPPVTPPEIPADTKKEKKPFPKAIIAVAAVLVAAIVILVIVNPFGGKRTGSSESTRKSADKDDLTDTITEAPTDAMTEAPTEAPTEMEIPSSYEGLDGDHHYDYEYDSSGNMVKRTYHSGGYSSIDKYEYDSAGNQIKAEGFDSSGKLEGGHEYEYDSEGRIIKDQVYINDTPDDEPWRALWWYEYEYDSKGNVLTKTECYDNGYRVEETYEYKYDKKNNIIESKHYKHGALKSHFEYEYQFDANGYIIQETAFNKTKNSKSRSEYQYDDDGKKIIEKDYDSEGVLDEVIIYQYDSKGNLIGEYYYN